ncbi:hypothetical protein HY251_16280 [bacterium]|nr:hypothetical protein [bacterium]
MGIDYVVDYDCEPKRALGLDRILELLKDRSRAAATLELLRQRGEADRPLEEIEFEFVARTPEGDLAPRRVKVKEVLDRAAALEEFAPACEGCPANNTGRAFGCMGAVGYPLSNKGESWLLSRVQPGPGADLLRAFVENIGITGGDISKMRAAGESFFEARTSPARSDLGFPLATDQLLEAIFCKGHLAPSHGAIMLLALSALRLERSVPEASDLPPGSAMLVGKDENGHETAQVYDIPAPDETDDDTIKELKQFLRALFLARGFGVRMLVDY